MSVRPRQNRDSATPWFPVLDKNALLVAAVYLGVTTAWIIGSDALVETLARGNLVMIQRLQMVKGIGFMLATAIGLYFLVASSLARQRRQADEMRRMEEMLSVSQRLEALGTLAATVVHDFNNIITVIRGMTELASLDGNDPGRMPERMRAIEKAVDQASHIVKQLTYFMHNAPHVFAPGDVARVIVGFEPMLRQAVGRHVMLRLAIPDETRPVVEHDRKQVEQVLLNLAVNARDAMEGVANSELTISVGVRTLADYTSVFNPARVSGTFVVLTVADMGCGIPPDNIVRIFSPFFTTKPEGKGTGLGLASVLRLMQQHQGWVEAESEQGAGTRFHLFFPVVSAGRVAD